MSLSNTPRYGAVLLLIVCFGVLLSGCDVTQEPPKTPFTLASSVYVGWMPWFLAAEDGTLAKRAEEYGLKIRFVTGDYVETIYQFAKGQADAVLLTNMDAAVFLTSKSVATDIVLIGSYSHGNDAILLRPQAAGDITRGPIGLVEHSVSHYLLDRYLQREGIPYAKVDVRNVSDSKMAVAFEAPTSDLMGVVTWNPMLQKIESRLKVVRLFDSRMIDGEVADILAVRRSTLERYPAFAQALLATWFDIMERMRGDRRMETLAALGRLSETDRAGYEKQLVTTLLMKTPEIALGYLRDPHLKTTMRYVQDFVDRHQVLSDIPTQPWVSYPGEEAALLRFNDRPLTKYIERAGG